MLFHTRSVKQTNTIFSFILFFHNIRQITNVMCNENDAFNDVWVHENFNMIINVYINILLLMKLMHI